MTQAESDNRNFQQWKVYKDSSDKFCGEYLETRNKDILKHHYILCGGEYLIMLALKLSQIFFQHTPTGEALDVGCGSGYMTHCLTNLGFQATGFDISEKAVEVAKKEYPELPFFCGDGANPKLYFPQTSIDFVWIREFHPFTRIDNFELQIQIIEEYLEILKEGGTIAIVQPKRKEYPWLNYWKVKKYFMKSNIRTGGPYRYYTLGMKRLQLFPSCGLIFRALSLAGKVVSRITGWPATHFFLIHKPGHSIKGG